MLASLVLSPYLGVGSLGFCYSSYNSGLPQALYCYWSLGMLGCSILNSQTSPKKSYISALIPIFRVTCLENVTLKTKVMADVYVF